MYSEKHVQLAIGRLSGQSSKEIIAVRERATVQHLHDLVAACDAELATRPFDYSAETAISFDRMAEEVKDMSLVHTIERAFTACPPKDYEARFLTWIAANPGASYQEALKAYGKKDLALVIGHLVYDRYGYFRRFVEGVEDQSSILFHKDRAGESVCYRLREEAKNALKL